MHIEPPLVRSFHQPPLGLGVAPVMLQREHFPGQSTPAMGEFARDYMESPDLALFLFRESHGCGCCSFGGVNLRGKDILMKVKK